MLLRTITQRRFRHVLVPFALISAVMLALVAVLPGCATAHPRPHRETVSVDNGYVSTAASIRSAGIVTNGGASEPRSAPTSSPNTAGGNSHDTLIVEVSPDNPIHGVPPGRYRVVDGRYLMPLNPGAENAGERYDLHAENPYIETAKEPLSTFAIDVDTASYTNMRRYVQGARRLPPPESVRIEEYVNYFEWLDEPAASLDRPIAVSLAAAPSPFAEGRHLVRVALKGYEMPEVERPPLNLVLLVDVSGSMAGPSRLPLVKWSLRHVLPRLRPTDSISLVTYASGSEVVLPPTPVAEAMRIEQAIDRLRASGSTHGEAGLSLAYQQAERAMRPDTHNRVLLCTDGDFNVGLTGNDLVRKIESERERGIFLSVLLYGTGNINDATMEAMTNAGNGNYFYIDSQEEAYRVLARRVISTLHVIAKDVKIQVEFNPQTVARHRLIGYENRIMAHEHFRDDRTDAGELGPGHSVVAYYEVVLHDDEAADTRADDMLVTARVRWKQAYATVDDPAEEAAWKLRRADAHGEFVAASPDFRFGAAVVQYGQILRQSAYVVESATLAHVLEIAVDASLDLHDRTEFVELVGNAMRTASR